MPIEKTKTGAIVITGDSIPVYRLLVLWSGLKLEAKTGMTRSRGQSCYSIVKAEFKLKGNKERVFAQFDKLMRERGVVRDTAAPKNICPVCQSNLGMIASEFRSEHIANCRETDSKDHAVMIGRAMFGVSLNGLEYIMEGKAAKQFENKSAAFAFLRANGHKTWTDERLEDTYTFEEVRS